MIFRPPTRLMLELLHECYIRHINNQEPYRFCCRAIKGLYARGLVQSRQYIDDHGKSFMAFYITDAGIKYLQAAELLAAS